MVDNIVSFTTETQRIKEKYLTKKMIDYYDTINQGNVSIPSFILAGLAVKRLKRLGRVDAVYSNLVKGF